MAARQRRRLYPSTTAEIVAQLAALSPPLNTALQRRRRRRRRRRRCFRLETRPSPPPSSLKPSRTRDDAGSERGREDPQCGRKAGRPSERASERPFCPTESRRAPRRSLGVLRLPARASLGSGMRVAAERRLAHRSLWSSAATLAGSGEERRGRTRGDGAFKVAMPWQSRVRRPCLGGLWLARFYAL